MLIDGTTRTMVHAVQTGRGDAGGARMRRLVFGGLLALILYPTPSPAQESEAQEDQAQEGRAQEGRTQEGNPARASEDTPKGGAPGDLPVLSLPGVAPVPQPPIEARSGPLSPRDKLRQSFLERMSAYYTKALRSRASVGLIPDGEVLFLDLILKRLLLSSGMLGVKSGDTVLFNFTEFLDAVKFAIEVDEEAGTAEGWFRSPDLRFSLDLEARRASVRGRTVSLPVGQVLRTGDGLLVHADLLEDWFGFEIHVDLLRQEARLSSATRLPVEDHLSRVRRFERLSEGTGGTQRLPEIGDPPGLVAAPNLDVQGVVGARGARGEGPEPFGRASIQGGGDLLFASGSFFAAGDGDQGITAARLRLERDDLQRLAPEQPLTAVALGDVRTPRLPLLGGNVEERGITLTNLSGEARAAVGVTDIIGEVTVGWDVELYRNAILIGFEPLNPDGRYEFRDVQLFPGRNVFRIVFYGPQGQVEEETRVVPLSTGTGVGGLPAFTASLTQQGRTLFNPNGASNQPGDGAVRAALDVSFPLADAGFAQLGFLTAANSGGRQTFLSARGTRFLGPVLIDAAAALEASLGNALEILVGGTVKGQQVRATAGLFTDFAPPGLDGEFSRLDLGLSTSGLLAVPVGRGLNYTATADWQSNGLTRTFIQSLSLGTQFGRLNLGTDLQRLAITEIESGEERRTWGGAAQGNLIIGRNVLRLATDFALAPRATPISATGTFALRKWEDVTASFQASRNFAAEITSFDARADWRIGNGFLGPRVAFDTAENFELSLQSRLSLGLSADRPVLSATPLSGRGMVQANVFLDADRDGVRDPDETSLADVTVEATRERLSAATDEGGRAILVGLPAGRRIDVRIADATLAESFLKPSLPGYSVRLRRGQTVTVDLPVVQTGEVEGQVLQREPEGVRAVQSATIVRLLSETGDVVEAVQVALDGFFVASDLPPGQYVLSVDPLSRSFAGAWQNVSIAPERVTVVEPIVLELGAGVQAPEKGKRALAADLGSFRSEFGALAQWQLLKRAFPDETRFLRRVRVGGSGGGVGLTVVSLGGAGRVLALCARLEERLSGCGPRLRTL